MSSHIVNISWHRSTQDFDPKTYDRLHNIVFPGGETIRVTSAPEFLGDPNFTNPEELFVSAIASCFMLTFLAVSANKGFIINEYVDQAEGILAKNEHGRMSVTEVTLKPEIVFQEDAKPDAETFKTMLEKAHANCFIANSVKTLVQIKPEYPEL